MREKLFAYRHLFALPALAIALPFLFGRWGHIPHGGALELGWDAAGGCALLCGQGLRIWAAGYMGRAGRSRRLKAATLLTAGPYTYVRNPLYLGNFLLCMGVILFTESYLLLLLAPVIFWALYLPVLLDEERFLHGQFGTDYAAYCLMVPRLLPRLRAAGPGQGSFQWRNLRKEYLSVTGILSAVLAVKALEPQAHTTCLLAIAGLLLLVPHCVEQALKLTRHASWGTSLSSRALCLLRRGLVFPLIASALVWFPPTEPRGNYLFDEVSDALGFLLALAGEALRLWTWGANATVEPETLSTRGPYTLLRHPLLVGNLLILSGLLVIVNNLLAYLLVLPACVFLAQRRATLDEQELRQRFGTTYQAYMDYQPSRFLPALRRLPQAWASSRPFHWAFALQQEYGVILAWVAGTVALEGYEEVLLRGAIYNPSKLLVEGSLLVFLGGVTLTLCLDSHPLLGSQGDQAWHEHGAAQPSRRRRALPFWGHALRWMPRRLCFALLSLLLFVSLALPAARHSLLPGDGLVYQALQAEHAPAFATFFHTVTQAGRSKVLGPVWLGVLLWQLPEWRRCLFLALYALGVPILEIGTKYAVARPRPPHALGPTQLFHPTHGFPSGHALAAAALYGLLLILLRRSVHRREWQVGVTGGLLLLIFLIGFSRLYLNAHWLSDVLGGYALGGAYCALATAVYGWSENWGERTHAQIEVNPGKEP